LIVKKKGRGVVAMKRYLSLFFLPSFFLFLGCASILSQRIPETLERPRPCQEFLERLDEKVREAGVRDASSFSVPGFPYLRTSRFLSALKGRLKNEEEREMWVRWMQELDLRSREKEISNLPDRMVLTLTSEETGLPDREGVFGRVASCSFTLLNHDRSRSDFYSKLKPLVKVPDEYSALLRIAGIYPLVALPVAAVTENSRKKIWRRFDTDLKDLPVDGSLRAFVPVKGESLEEKEVGEILEASRKNPLKVPLPDTSQEKKLVETFAPIFIQDEVALYDRIGRVKWEDHRIKVNPERPAVYYYLSHTFLKGEPVLQINYAIWYSERAGENPPSIEKGHLDGLTARISLDGQGKIFMVDVENNCGCYHLFAPDQERMDRILSRPLMFDAMVPQWLPKVPPGQHLGIRISSGWHQVQRLMSVKEAPDPIPYELIPYGALESIPHKDGRRESIFDAKGVAKGSERVERFILFSMGIPSIGSMRQRGHHAIELIGRVHFDDPRLFDQNFVFK
jgi:hypothetical protein